MGFTVPDNKEKKFMLTRKNSSLLDVNEGINKLLEENNFINIKEN